MKVVGLRCKLCGLKVKNWKSMQAHLKGEHGKNPVNVTWAIQQKIVAYIMKKNFVQKRKVYQTRPKQTKNNTPSVQEIVIPIYLKIPLAIGSVGLIQLQKEGDK